MGTALRRRFRLFNPVLLVAAALAGSAASAQPVLDEFVGGAKVVARKECTLLSVHFNVRVRYTGHFPSERGDELRITLQLIDRDLTGAVRLARREGVRVDNAKAAGIKVVVLELDQGPGPVLRIQFDRPVAYKVSQSANFENVIVAMFQKGTSAGCKADDITALARANGADASRSDRPAGGESVRARGRASGHISEAGLKVVEAAMDEGRAAIKKSNFKQAVQLFKKVLKYPENKYSAEAQELLGVAHQKAGQIKDARAEYEDYLRRYKGGEGSERIRQRLSGLLTAAGEAPEKLRGSLEPDAPKGGAKKLGGDGETQATLSGSVSSFYIRDDSFNTVKDISTAPNPNADPDAHRTHQNTLLSNLDAFGTWTNEQVKSKFKFSATEEHRLDVNKDTYGISTFSVETLLRQYDLMVRLGRQTRSTAGVIGRFDGGVLSWQAPDGMRYNVVAGSPNLSRFDEPFKNDKSLYGASVDIGKMFGGLETSLFAIEQRDRDVVDRRSVGAEFRYFDKDKSALGTIDYDIYFQQLNAAILSGSWSLPDKSVVTGALDYRKVPYLSSWNALQGQPFLTLYDMLKFNTQEEVKQFAIDRTPTFESAMIGYSRPLSEKFQISTDATVTWLTGTPPSGGVDGMPASGTEWYLSTQLIGSSIFTTGDMFIAAARYANLADSQVYVLDFNSSYPLTNAFRISPRLRLGYRTVDSTDLKEVTVLPSVLLNYMWTKDFGLELEVGSRWISSDQSGVETKTTELFITAGIRYDFNLDGKRKCAAGPIQCALAGSVLPAAEPIPFYQSAPAVTSAFSWDGGIRYWYSSARNRYDYFADSTATQLNSRLNYDGLTAHSGELFFRVDAISGPLKYMFVKGYVGGGSINDGNLLDEDLPPVIDTNSKTTSDTKGKLRYGSVDLGYSLYTDRRVRLGAFAGYHYWFESVDANGCNQIGGHPWICAPELPTSMKVITEQDRWNTLRLGGVADVNLTDRLRWTGEIAYALTAQRPQDTHYFTFGVDPGRGHGSGVQAETVLTYQVTDRMSVGLGGRWWHFKTDALDAFDQRLKYVTDRYGVFVQAGARF